MLRNFSDTAEERVPQTLVRTGAALWPEWQTGLLSFTLRITGVVDLLAAVIVTLFLGVLRTEFAVIAVVGAILLLFSRFGYRFPRTTSIGYFSVICFTVVMMGLKWAWMPTVVVSVCYAVIIAGLFIGKKAVYGIVLILIGLMATGGFFMQSGLFELGAPIHPKLQASWIRTAIAYMMVTGGAALILRRAVEVVLDAENTARESLSEVRKTLFALQKARESRIGEERRLRDVQKLQMVAQLGDGFAHLFNNFLTVVRCAFENIKRADTEQIRLDATRLMCNAAENCAGKTRELLMLSRPHDVEAAPMVLAEKLEQLRPKLAARVRDNIACKFQLDPAGEVLLSTTWLDQIVSNLLLNAQQAMPNGGLVKIETRSVHLENELFTGVTPLSAGQYVTLSVVDNGEGMVSEVCERACEPFFTTKGRERHDGLGLSLVHSMVNRLGGAVQISSESGQTNVTLYLPKFQNDVAEAGLSPSNKTPVTKTDVKPESSKVTTPVTSESSCIKVLFQERRGTAESRAENRTQHREDVSDAEKGGEILEPNGVNRGGQSPHVDWQMDTLNRLLTLTIGVVVFVTVLAVLFMKPALSLTTYGVIGLCVSALVIARCNKRWPLVWRLSVLIITFVAGAGYTMIQLSYLSTAVVGLLAFSVFLAAVFGNRTLMAIVLIVTTNLFILGGWLWGQGLVDNSYDGFSPSLARNWFRTGLVLPSMALLIASMVLRIFNAARDQVAVVQATRLQLEQTRREQHKEAQTASELAAMRTRAAHMESSGRITGMVAHDLNNSLTGILGWGELLQRVTDKAKQEKAMRSIEEAIDYTESLVQQLQLRGSGTRTDVVCHLSSILSRMSSMLEVVLQHQMDKEISFVLDTEEECYVAMDEPSFRRLVLNLVTNARDAMGHGYGGVCRIKLKRIDEHVELVVEDEGTGIEEGTKKRLFDAFFTTKEDGGTGLGLHTVAEIVKTTKGEIDLWSEEGRGCLIRVCWPAAAPNRMSAYTEERVPVTMARGKILLAEDEPLVRQLLVLGLESSGYELLEAKDGDEAAVLLSKTDVIDALCTDAIMPGLPTPKLIANFRVRFPEQPVVVMSGHLPEAFGEGLLNHPKTHFMAKPFSHTELVRTLMELLS